MCDAQVDGAYAAVRFNTSQGEGLGSRDESPAALLQECRLLRKDELQV